MKETTQENPYIREEGNNVAITEAGECFLKNIVTDPSGDIYVFTKNADPILTAAAMARLSRSPHDLRVTYLREFAHVAGAAHAEALFSRVLAEYGDDSVAQLATLAAVCENASNILTKQLEWGRLAGYLEQSTRYIFFDQPKADGSFRYYTPPLPEKLRARYVARMNCIFELYSQVVRSLTEYVRNKEKEKDSTDPKEHAAWLGSTRAQACDAARPMLPAATTSTVGIVATAQSFERLIWLLAGNQLSECQNTARVILREVRKVAPAFFTRTDMPERGGAMVDYAIKKRNLFEGFCEADGLTKPTWDGVSVRLIDFWPVGELDLLPEMLFKTSGLPLQELKKITWALPIGTQEELFCEYMGERLNRRHKPDRALEKLHYEWEIVGDYGTFRDLQRHRMVDSFEWQSLTPDYGFEVPELIKEAGFDGIFSFVFLEAKTLYHILQSEGYVAEAQYATLLGHRMRYRFILNARAAFHFHELRTGPQGHPGYRKIVQEMHRQLSVVHPRIGKAMKFVNMGEDPALTRLAGELATQRKLTLLDSAKNSL